MTSRLSLWAIWRVPMILAAFTLAGLLLALLGQGGLWWWASWITLAVPLAVVGTCVMRRNK